MTASATLTLYHARAARSAQSKVKVAREDRAFFQNSQPADGGNRQVTEVRHRADIGSVPAGNGNGHFSTERNNFHDDTSPSAPRNYRDGPRMASSKNVTSVISDDEIRSSLDEIFLTRPVKEVSAETGFTIAALNKWRANGSVPQWIVDGFVLTVKNARIWAAAKRLRLLEDAAELDRQIAELQAMRRGLNHGSHQGNSRVAVSASGVSASDSSGNPHSDRAANFGGKAK